MHNPVNEFRAAILAVLGGAPEDIEPGRLHRFSTNGRRGDTSGWCRLYPDLKRGAFGDWRTGADERWLAHDADRMTRKQRASLARHVQAARAQQDAKQQQQWAANAKRNSQLWAQCKPLTPGDPVTLYLTNRGIDLRPLPACLRCHPALEYWHERQLLGTFPAMAAPITAPNGQMVALHRTYLTRVGRKADVPTPKKVTGASAPLAGACIATGRPQAGCIGIAEGIETALAAWSGSSVPTVAAYCASLLAAWHWPAGTRRVVIFADNDKAGREAAEALKARLSNARLRCEVLMPSDEGADWCDVRAAA